MLDNTIGDNIRRFRKEAKLTQEKLAKRLCMTRQTLSNYETGKRIPDVYTLAGMADIFETSLDILAGRDKTI